MISSPGPAPVAPTAAYSPDVAALTVTAWATPKYSHHSRSSFCTRGPPTTSGDHGSLFFFADRDVRGKRTRPHRRAAVNGEFRHVAAPEAPAPVRRRRREA